jgi:hypothetical protein
MVIPYKFGSSKKSTHSKVFAGKSLLHKSPLKFWQKNEIVIRVLIYKKIHLEK